ncbi:hypothetical protein BDV26DRAFT_262792 [Aspergillus bertholletiae]|uniref:Uncharacterized protein n=1 Tax=Aspergillus bertholletiae TaxID=1226010 RepID=A0A5N7B7V8_9EURO|nr:hypothetical protein BDV26DRAFT_262792 [Aspergillus bertholletiae]
MRLLIHFSVEIVVSFEESGKELFFSLFKLANITIAVILISSGLIDRCSREHLGIYWAVDSTYSDTLIR